MRRFIQRHQLFIDSIACILSSSSGKLVAQSVKLTYLFLYGQLIARISFIMDKFSSPIETERFLQNTVTFDFFPISIQIARNRWQITKSQFSKWSRNNLIGQFVHRRYNPQWNQLHSVFLLRLLETRTIHAERNFNVICLLLLWPQHYMIVDRNDSNSCS